VLLPEQSEEEAAVAVPPAEVGDTVTVTSLETVAEPQVGVEVQTTYQVPAPPISVAVGV
jgi:hypothetical protein